MAYLDDIVLDDLIAQLESNFGSGEKETITESSYSFSGKQKEMREDILFLRALQREGEGKLRMKSKLGFD